jgi:hypothetical protein
MAWTWRIAKVYLLLYECLFLCRFPCIRGERERDRQTDRQTQRQRQRQRHRDRERDRETDTERGKGAISSAFWTEVPYGKVYAHIAVHWVVTAVLDLLIPLVTRLLRSSRLNSLVNNTKWLINRSPSALGKGGALEVWATCLRNVYEVLRAMEGLSSGINVAGFRFCTTAKVRWGRESNRLWYWVMQAFDTHWWFVPLRRVSTAGGAVRVKPWTRASLSLFLISIAVSTMVQKQDGQSEAIGFKCLNWYTTGLQQGPWVWSVQSWNSLLTSGRAKARAWVRVCFSCRKACSSNKVYFKDWSPMVEE